jgi:hypothetical protein
VFEGGEKLMPHERVRVRPEGAPLGGAKRIDAVAEGGLVQGRNR